MSNAQPQFLDVGENKDALGPGHREIAVSHRPAIGEDGRPGLFWLSGFKSDMSGSKAVALDAFAAEEGLACTRFDYSGHGLSGGDFENCGISDWLEDALAVFDEYCDGPTILVGSSMGGWMALLVALARKSASIKGMALIAPAVDFTEELMWKDRFTDDIREAIMTAGRWQQPSSYSEDPYVITRRLIESGRKHLLLGREIDPGCPVTILQGAQDPDVPWQHAMRLVQSIPRDDVTVSLVQDGDHRLSRPQDLELLIRAITGLLTG